LNICFHRHETECSRPGTIHFIDAKTEVRGPITEHPFHRHETDVRGLNIHSSTRTDVRGLEHLFHRHENGCRGLNIHFIDAKRMFAGLNIHFIDGETEDKRRTTPY